MVRTGREICDEFSVLIGVSTSGKRHEEGITSICCVWVMTRQGLSHTECTEIITSCVL